MRPLEHADHQLLASFATDLPVLEKVGIYSEDEFEARLHLGPKAREVLLREGAQADAARRRYLFDTVDVKRARRHVEQLQKMYGGRCQICLFDPRARYGRRLCHGHHIQWLSRGGEDELDNMVLICPHHQSAVHQDDAVFDFGDLTFRFANGLVEPLTLCEHLKAEA
ncbi:MAG TPA: HNH endonuclease [Longimicrobium sp.]|nr:HNH endonuclease [Longimicrobium sp.]